MATLVSTKDLKGDKVFLYSIDGDMSSYDMTTVLSDTGNCCRGNIVVGVNIQKSEYVIYYGYQNKDKTYKMDNLKGEQFLQSLLKDFMVNNVNTYHNGVYIKTKYMRGISIGGFPPRGKFTDIEEFWERLDKTTQ